MPNYFRFEDEETQFFLDLWLFSRCLKDFTKAIREKKNTSGLKAVSTNLAAIGLKIAGMVLSAGGTEMLGMGTAAAEAWLSNGATLAELSAEGISVPAAEKVAGKTTTTVVGQSAPASFSSFSNMQEKRGVAEKVSAFVVNAAKNALMIPQMIAVLNGLKQIRLDSADWQRAKRDLIRSITTIIGILDEIIPWDDADREVTWKGSRVSIRKKTITSKQLLAKYQKRVEEFTRAVADRDERKERTMNEPLLDSADSSD